MKYSKHFIGPRWSNWKLNLRDFWKENYHLLKLLLGEIDTVSIWVKAMWFLYIYKRSIVFKHRYLKLVPPSVCGREPCTSITLLPGAWLPRGRGWPRPRLTLRRPRPFWRPPRWGFMMYRKVLLHCRPSTTTVSERRMNSTRSVPSVSRDWSEPTRYTNTVN